MPDTPTAITLTTPVSALPGVAGRQLDGLARLEIRSAADLIRHLPARYEHELAEQTIEDADRLVRSGGEVNVALRGELAAVRPVRGRRPRLDATLADGSGTTVKLTWFNMPWLAGRLHPGQSIRAWGRAKLHGDYLQMVNPKWAALDPDGADDDEPAPTDAPREERFRPVYPANELITSAQIDAAVTAALDPILAHLDDHLPPALREQLAMPELRDAYRRAHAPDDESEAAAARRRLAFDELFMLQLGVMLKRHQRRARLHAIALQRTDAIDQHIIERFPFPLTGGQRAVIDEIADDLTGTVPMNRLLQGDVGAGKTVVALYAMLMAIASGHQAALMAPTELLADQHFASITRLLQGGRVNIELLTGSVPAAQRAEIEQRLADGDVDLVIGTHALLTERVSFQSLAVAVIDEQHRFGVHQRATVRAKATDPQSCPHVLVMTATPIPRTMSLTIFGDLDVSTIRELPPGRKPVITRAVAPGRREVVYDYLRERLDAGDQAYVVVPVIDESAAGLTDVESHRRWLEEGPLRGARLEALHGRLPREEREAIMQRFRDGDVQALVATTVIEVGVDVANANIMVIEHADRFGLAQLHQLRGRVGRSTDQGLCVLVADPATDDGRARIAAITSSNDGFVIAEKDLEIRGPGELFGARQSGVAPFRVARLPRDTELLRLARRHAEALVESNPTLAGEDHALLKRRLLKAHGDALGLGDVA